jgi:uncharacterized LabA/DUF88 family protein
VTVDAAPASARLQRVRVFIDFWNFQLSANDAVGGKFPPDWQRLPRWLATDAAASITGVPVSGLQYEGASVYLSVAPGAADARLRDWATKFLDRVSGVTVVLKERVKKLPPACQNCHERVETCCHCGAALSLTEEKGVDVAIATDMIKLAWEDAYDWAVLVSSDRDFIPAVEFLNAKGCKVLHAGFPPRGSQLAAKCWGSLDLRPHLAALSRT